MPCVRGRPGGPSLLSAFHVRMDALGGHEVKRRPPSGPRDGSRRTDWLRCRGQSYGRDVVTKVHSKNRSRASSVRNQRASTPSGPARKRTRSASNCSAAGVLSRAIDEERIALLRASNVLRCLSIALEHPPDDPTDRPYYADVAALATSIIDGVLDRLDHALMGGIGSGANDSAG